MTPTFGNLPKLAEDGDLAAQRALVAFYATSASDAADPAATMEVGIYFGRMAALQGERSDTLQLVGLLMARAGLSEALGDSDGDRFGRAAVSLIDLAADEGDEDAGASLQALADKLPRDLCQRFFGRRTA